MAAAREVCAALRPVTTRLMVVGAVRRRCAEVGAVDVLYVPRFEDRQLDMFTTEPMDMSEEVVGGLVLSGVLSKRPRMIGGQPSESFTTWGAQNKLAVYRGGVPVDLFKSKDEDWWNAVVFRTGSEQSNLRIAEAAQARGWKWNISGAGFERGEMLGPIEKHGVESEQEVFAFVGLPYLEPEEREVFPS